MVNTFNPCSKCGKRFTSPMISFETVCPVCKRKGNVRILHAHIKECSECPFEKGGYYDVRCMHPENEGKQIKEYVSIEDPFPSFCPLDRRSV